MGAVFWNLVVSLGRSRPVNEVGHLNCQTTFVAKNNQIVCLWRYFLVVQTAYSSNTVVSPKEISKMTTVFTNLLQADIAVG